MNTLMICGGTPPSIQLYNEIIHKYTPECLIAVDFGAAFFYENGVVPDILVGDFDSIAPEILEYYRSRCEVIPLICEKDETDSEIGLGIAMEKGATDLLILGATGGRIDHTIANMYLLKKADECGVFAKIIDERQEIFIISNGYTFERLANTLVSFLPVSDVVSNITTSGFYYPLNGESLGIGDVRGISNVIVEDYATISLESGYLFCIMNISV